MSPRPRSRNESESPEEEGAEERSLESPFAQLVESLSGLRLDLRSSAFKLASRTGASAARAIARSPEQLRVMANAGESLRDAREVAGLTVSEIADALKLRDKGVWEAIEDGREVLSFDLILRLASLVARNDPLPFILKYTRTYHPRLGEILKDLKIDRLPLHFERERKFINIYRRHDAARKLSDESFERVHQFTQGAFDLAMQLVVEQERIVAEARAEVKEKAREEKREEKKAAKQRSAKKRTRRASVRRTAR